MRCSKAQNLISLAMDESLAAPEGIALERHLEDCPDCVTYRQDLLRCRELLQESEMAPSASFEWKVQLGIQKALREAAASRQERPRRPFWLPAGLSAALTAAVVLAVGMAWLGGGDGPARTTDPAVEPAGVPTSSPVAQAASPHRFQGEDWLLDRSGRLAGPDGRAARVRWDAPGSLQGRITTVRDLHSARPRSLAPDLRLRYVQPSPRRGAAPSDSLDHSAAPAVER